MIFPCLILGAQWWFGIWNLKLRAERNSGKLFTQGIWFETFSNKYCVGKTGSDTLTLGDG